MTHKKLVAIVSAGTLVLFIAFDAAFGYPPGHSFENWVKSTVTTAGYAMIASTFEVKP